MSSITAAPRIMRLVWTSSRFIEASTRAVMPTEVATSAVPINSDSTLPAPHKHIKKYPATNGAITPSTATTAALVPTLNITEGLVSSPTVKRRKITPISANVLVISEGATQRRTL